MAVDTAPPPVLTDSGPDSRPMVAVEAGEQTRSQIPKLTDKITLVRYHVPQGRLGRFGYFSGGRLATPVGLPAVPQGRGSQGYASFRKGIAPRALKHTI